MRLLNSGNVPKYGFKLGSGFQSRTLYQGRAPTEYFKVGEGGGVQRRGISVGIRLGVKSVVEAFQRQVNKSSHRKPVIALNDGGG